MTTVSAEITTFVSKAFKTLDGKIHSSYKNCVASEKMVAKLLFNTKLLLVTKEAEVLRETL